jgi:hypothetical protein
MTEPTAQNAVVPLFSLGAARAPADSPNPVLFADTPHAKVEGFTLTGRGTNVVTVSRSAKHRSRRAKTVLALKRRLQDGAALGRATTGGLAQQPRISRNSRC